MRVPLEDFLALTGPVLVAGFAGAGLVAYVRLCGSGVQYLTAWRQRSGPFTKGAVLLVHYLYAAGCAVVPGLLCLYLFDPLRSSLGQLVGFFVGCTACAVFLVKLGVFSTEKRRAVSAEPPDA